MLIGRGRLYVWSLKNRGECIPLTTTSLVQIKGSIFERLRAFTTDGVQAAAAGIRAVYSAGATCSVAHPVNDLAGPLKFWLAGGYRCSDHFLTSNGGTSLRSPANLKGRPWWRWLRWFAIIRAHSQRLFLTSRRPTKLQPCVTGKSTRS